MKKRRVNLKLKRSGRGVYSEKLKMGHILGEKCPKSTLHR